MSILIGDGAGGFIAPANLAVPLQAGSESRAFALGDINGDGNRDLGVIEILGATRRVLLYFGNGAGGFTSQELTTVPGAFRMIAGDVNGDGRQDLAVSTGNIVHVFLGNGTGGFGPSTPFSTPSALQFELTDLNGDGRLDIAAAMNQGPGVAILLNGCGQPTGNLVLSAFDSPDPVAEGAPVTYSSTVTNAGATLATNVTLTQTLSGLGVAGTASSSQGACTISGNRLVMCNLGSLAPNASADVQVTFTPSVGGSLSSVIGVGSERPDSNPADNVVTLTTTVTAAGRSSWSRTRTTPASARCARRSSTRTRIAATATRSSSTSLAPACRTITPLTALPVISQPVVIDGTEPPSSAPLIELNGNGLAAPGLTITGGNSIVRGLVINRFGGPGILLQTNGGNVIAGNYIGVDALATTSRPNGGHGVHIDGTPGNTVGGLEPAARNVISGTFERISSIEVEAIWPSPTGPEVAGSCTRAGRGGVVVRLLYALKGVRRPARGCRPPLRRDHHRAQSTRGRRCPFVGGKEVVIAPLLIAVVLEGIEPDDLLDAGLLELEVLLRQPSRCARPR